MIEATTPEINDTRHKLPSESVVQAHKQIRVSQLRMPGRHKIRGPQFVGGHSRTRPPLAADRPDALARGDLDELAGDCQDEPGKRTRRSLTYSPRLSELLPGERGSGLARAAISLDARLGHASLDFPPQSLQLSLQRIQFRTGDTDQLGCFCAHAAPSVRRFRSKCRSMSQTRVTLADHKFIVASMVNRRLGRTFPELAGFPLPGPVCPRPGVRSGSVPRNASRLPPAPRSGSIRASGSALGTGVHFLLPEARILPVNDALVD